MNNFTEGVDFYYNEEGLMVLTSSYHLRRGKCCGKGCRHCPYEYENTDPELKERLMRERPPVILMKTADAN